MAKKSARAFLSILVRIFLYIFSSTLNLQVSCENEVKRKTQLEKIKLRSKKLESDEFMSINFKINVYLLGLIDKTLFKNKFKFELENKLYDTIYDKCGLLWWKREMGRDLGEG